MKDSLLMSQMQLASIIDSPPGGLWSQRHKSFWLIFKQLMKKHFLAKTRNYAPIIELILALILGPPVSYAFYKLAREKFDGHENPQVAIVQPLPIELLIFLGIAPNSHFILAPDIPIFHQAKTMFLDLIETAEQYLNRSISINVDIVDSVQEIKDLIYSVDAQSLGIHWRNALAADNKTSPQIDTYYQALSDFPGSNIAELTWRAMMMLNGKEEEMLSLFTKAPFASVPSEEIYDIALITAIMIIFPMILASMPDFQLVLEEKDTRVQTMTFLMGCPESVYWLATITSTFICSIIPYLVYMLFLAYGFAMVGTDFSLLLVVNVLFVIDHIMFIYWLSTFMKKASAGRVTVILILIFTIFFAYFHEWYTLTDRNSSEGFKHVLSIIPISAYQMFMMISARQSRLALRPIGWSDWTTAYDYKIWYAVMWLLVDFVIYTSLFLLCNLTMSRDFGTPLIAWNELFSLQAWKRLFDKKDISQVGQKTDDLIEVDGVCKTYFGESPVVALTDVAFKIKQGEVIIMIGPNGAGKSTLMNIMSGALEATAGTLTLAGAPPTHRFVEIQRYLGVCFQENVIINYLTIPEHFALFGSFRGVNSFDLEEGLHYFSENLQLSHMLTNRAGDLSGGQKRKLCISLSLIGNPPIVIMDEPTAGVDVQARQLIWKTISMLKESTAIITSHALEEAEAVSTRLFVVANGHLPFTGTATELREQFKCGYLLRVDGPIEKVLELSQSMIPGTHQSIERNDTIILPVTPQIGKFIEVLSEQKEELGITTFSFGVEQLEDVLLKLIQSEEVSPE